MKKKEILNQQQRNTDQVLRWLLRFNIYSFFFMFGLELCGLLIINIVDIKLCNNPHNS